jgi:hypothetical protein
MLTMEVMYAVLFLLPLIVDLCIGYDAYMNSHSVRKAMVWFFAGVSGVANSLKYVGAEYHIYGNVMMN